MNNIDSSIILLNMQQNTVNNLDNPKNPLSTQDLYQKNTIINVSNGEIGQSAGNLHQKDTTINVCNGSIGQKAKNIHQKNVTIVARGKGSIGQLIGDNF